MTWFFGLYVALELGQAGNAKEEKNMCRKRTYLVEEYYDLIRETWKRIPDRGISTLRPCEIANSLPA
jgi:hypothetical protein